MVLDIVQEEVLEEGKKEIIRADFKKGNDKGRFFGSCPLHRLCNYITYQIYGKSE